MRARLLLAGLALAILLVALGAWTVQLVLKITPQGE